MLQILLHILEGQTSPRRSGPLSQEQHSNRTEAFEQIPSQSGTRVITELSENVNESTDTKQLD
ncbi:hypothetical protein J6590_067589 [Homalodisca vitripennis]|nr:hypothetical protein J6590_067589 [Homalodisca vitripennis]